MRGSARARARRLPGVFEKGTRPGGSMLLSSGVDLALPLVRRVPSRSAREATQRLQRLVFDRLDEGLEWLESLGAPVLARETGNPLTIGVRFDPAGLTDALVRARRRGPSRPAGGTSTGGAARAGDAAASRATPELVERYVRPAAPLRLRANPWSAGDGLRAAGSSAAPRSRAGWTSSTAATWPTSASTRPEFVPLAQVYGRFARIFNERGEEFFDRTTSRGPRSTSSRRPPTSPAREPGTCSTSEALDERVRGRHVRELVADGAHAHRTRPSFPFAAPEQAVVAVRVAAAITHTIGGAPRRRAGARAGRDDEPIDGLFAAGADAGGHLDRRLRERAGLGARARPRGRRERALS